jgi:hypothetical protein
MPSPDRHPRRTGSRVTCLGCATRWNSARTPVAKTDAACLRCAWPLIT